MQSERQVGADIFPWRIINLMVGTDLEILKAMFGTSYCQLPEEKFNKYEFLYPFIPSFHGAL